MEKTKEKKVPILRNLFRFAGGHKYLTILGMILSGLSAAITLLPIIFIWYGVREIVETYPVITMTESIWRNAILAVVCSLLAMAVYTAALFCTHLSAFRIARNIRQTAIAHMMKLPLGYFNTTGSGKLRRVINDSAGATETYLAHQLPDMIGAFTTPVCVLAILAIFDWRIGLISLISIVLGFIAMSITMGGDRSARIKKYQTALEDMNNEATEYVRGIPVVKTFNQSIFSFERFHRSILNYREYVIDFTYNARKPMVLFQTFLGSTPIFLVLSAIFMIGTEADPKQFFLNFFFYLLFTPICSLMLMKIMWVSQHTMMATDALDRIDEFLTEKPMAQPSIARVPSTFNIELDNISFKYPLSDVQTLSNINLDIKQGATVALVGPSGGGKSTLATLLARFWDVDSGSIKIGGIDVKDIGESELMKNISFVFQNTNLYKASILDNLKEGNPNATPKQIEAALRAARCEDIIAKLPQGVDTVYGTKGVYLSGGEAQRIALARAILKDAPIILLDEATAFTDPENEHEIQLAFNELTKGKTVLIIAHRLSTVQNADCIFLLDEGQIKESGTHEQLLQSRGLYSEMWEEYNSAFIWNESGVIA